MLPALQIAKSLVPAIILLFKVANLRQLDMSKTQLNLLTFDICINFWAKSATKKLAKPFSKDKFSYY